MSKKVLSVVFVLVFLLFIGVMDYPFIARLINEHGQSEVVAEYDSAVAKLAESDIEENLRLAKEYNESFLSGTRKQQIPDSFDVSGGSDSYYNSLLRVTDDGVMASIVIPKIKVELPVYHGTNEYSLENGAGHVEGSSLPVGGDSTHACMAAHRGLPSKRMFTDLDQIVIGDKFYIRIYDEILAYKVYEVEVVVPEDVEDLQIQKGKDLATLITCTPYGVNSHRIYVHGYRVPYNPGDQDMAFDIMAFLKRWWWAILTVLLLIWMIFLLRRFNKKGESNEQQTDK